ncbi:RANBP2-like and GRIP domain-containing protein 8 [Monodelphis domestica]|uniref:RANBP2-like and GRIP domain-containing protein 8 n=1 Tax=Monodelphis domestica TaxID=13616 RepID=UPI0024E1D314|nr:RANBP2-like and GRIP domain-containing protein 8 [Monodelphis domestica]
MEAAKETLENQRTSTENVNDTNRNPQFEPIPLDKIKTLEEDEEELFRMRAKLFRFTYVNGLPKWKERGTGDMKLLKHKKKGTIRLLMRRSRTLKICANHYVTPWMELKSNVWSDRAWVWYTQADFADETLKHEVLAIRFLNAENAQKFKAKFEECRNEIKEKEERLASGRNPTLRLLVKEDSQGEPEGLDKVVQKLKELSVEEDRQGKSESLDKVAPKLELSVEDDSQGKSESHEISQKPGELLVKEDSQGEPNDLDKIVQKLEEFSVEEDSQGKSESLDKVAPKLELSVEDDSQGKSESHEISQKPGEQLVKEDNQGEPKDLDKVVQKLEEFSVEEDSQGKSESRDKVAPKLELSVQDDGRGKSESHEISPKSEFSVEEASQKAEEKEETHSKAEEEQ